MMTPATSGENFSFLTKAGETGMLIQAKDWSKTSLGAIDNWPQSLRTTLSIILNSKFPMFLFWGADLVCFYNDAYRPSLGKDGKHPIILGMKGEEAWREIWTIIKPLIDQVISGGEATWNEDQLIPIYRNGKMEDVYWTFSYSPVNDESGKPAGVFVTCSETTNKVLNYTLLEESKNQLEFAIEAAELGTWDINPVTKKFSCNSRLKEWFGLRADEEIEFALNNIAEKDRQRVAEAIQNALQFSRGGLYDIEYTIVHPLSGKERIVNARGKALFNEDKIAIRFQGVIQDVTAQVTARQKIEESEQRFQAAINAVKGILWTNNAKGEMEGEQPGWTSLTGQSFEEYQGYGWSKAIHPDDAQPTIDAWNHAVSNRSTFLFEHRVKMKDDNWGHFSIKAVPILHSDGSIKEWVGVHTDITRERQVEKALKESGQSLRNIILNAPVALCILKGPEHVVEIANDRMFKLWGKPSEELLNKPVFEGLPEARQQGLESVLRHVYTTGETFIAYERPIHLPRGEEIEITYINFVYEPIYEVNGFISGIMAVAIEVTDQVIARKNIEEREKEFRQLADSLPEMVWTTDNKGAQTFASKRWKDFTGLDPYDENTFLQMVHPDDVERVTNVWSNCLLNGETYRTQVRLKSKTGDYQWFYANGEPVKNSHGAIEKWVGAFTNINEQKKAEEELVSAFLQIEENETRLRNSADKLNILITASELGTWELNLITKEVNYSDRYLEIFGYKERVSLTHGEILKHLHPDDLSIRERAFKHAITTGILYYRARLIWNDQSIHWMEGKGKLFYNEKNEPLKIIGTIRDITEEILHQQELKESEEKFRLLADSMPQHIWTASPDGNLNYFNQSVFDYSGLTPEQINKDGWIQIVHPEDREENIRAWAKAITTGTDFLYEHRFRKFDGEYRWQLSRAVPQRDANGNIQMWVGTSTDIQEMKEQDQEKDYFISLASHELKTPITSIKGYTQLLKSMHADSDDAFLKKSLNVIDKQVATLTNLISEMLDVSKIKSGILLLNKATFSIDDLIQEVIDEISHINPSYTINFSKVSTVLVEADRERIRQVLINLLTNAVKYSPSSKSINVFAFIQGQKIVVSVEDSGIGISKNEQKKIFERFYRVEGKSEKTFSGFGIGLFIAAEIIHKHNGTVGVDSEPGKGSVFSFSLPL